MNVAVTRSLLNILLFLLFVLHGCIIIPTPENKVISGRSIGDEELSFIEQGITTKDDVVAQLGEPDVFWVDERIFAYDWEMRQAIMPWCIGNPYQAVGGVEEIDKDYVLLIQFDQNDFVKRFEKTTRSMFESYGDHLTEWVEQGKEPPSAESQE